MSLSSDDIKLLGASMYLCEGTKLRIDNRGWKQYVIEFTNKDPRAISLFLKYLREVIKAEEERVKLQIFIYEDHNEQELVSYWSSVTRITPNRINKTIRMRTKNEKYKPNPLGVAKIRYHHKVHFLQIMEDIQSIFGKDTI